MADELDRGSNENVRKRPARIIKRNRRIYSDDSVRPETPRKQAKPSPLKSTPRSEKLSAPISLHRLRNILKLPKAHKWVCYEWFYSTIDQALLLGENDFQAVLRENFPELGTSVMRKAEWTKIRRLMGKPRRCSESFFTEERRVLELKRNKIRLIQQRKLTDLSSCDMKDLPELIPLALVIGTEVTALLRSPQDGLYTGVIDAVDTANNTYRITFDRSGLGTHTVPDYEVLANRLQDTIPLSSFLHKVRPQRLALMTPPKSHLQLNNDPLLSCSPVSSKAIGDQTGSLGGFPVQFLLQITKLHKSLIIKREKIDELKAMNAKAEKLSSYQEPLSVEFQKRYAYDILELEELNRRLEDHLLEVQKYSKDLSRDQGIDNKSLSLETKHGCEQEAKEMLQQRAKELKFNIQNESMLLLITKLTAVLLQLRALGDSEVNMYDLRSIQKSLEEIRDSTDSSNSSCFRNNVEVHVNHIQSKLTQMGNLHAFTASTHQFF